MKYKSRLEKHIHEANPMIDQESQYENALTFHENTKFGRNKSQDLFLHIGRMKTDEFMMNKTSMHYKEYDGNLKISLKKINSFLSEKEKGITETIIERRSIRQFENKPISFDSLSKMLVLSYGITGALPFNENKTLYLRATPSGGALYPLEIYPVILNVESCEKGVYHYNVLKNCLELIKKGDFTEKMFSLLNDQDFVKKAAVVFLITAIPNRTLYKYRDRGLRFIYIDAGHLVQNMSLLAVSENVGTCAIGGVFDYEAEDFLEIDGYYETMVYALAAGTASI